ncbi:phosphoribosylglycinamide formyltransferase [Catenovulum sp. SM1970]|uniref:phosphoribosylglycinamide formyltransferase n=1 Tax=Marinifaba aquimaris TaxID=2741323 RepID=UPI0015724CF8|nr:phosphoribosylglycinamide formyltransferase [Marinifaba aquimaris]NTS76060.1 phosphoribosylglycinamide formyltransferase [Marinifaba aquimaris]
MSTPSIVVLISGSGSNLQAIIDACNAENIQGEIKAVISNVESAFGLERAAKANIATQVVNHKAFETREAYDEALAQTIDEYQPDLVVLAGFMRILTADFVRHYKGKMLNIHPSLLPKYQGLYTHQRAIDAGDCEHGVSVHFVTEELDGGPVILQAKVQIEADDTAETLAQKVHVQEHIIYPQVVQWFCQGRLQMNEGYAVLDEKQLPENGAKTL